jgi:hypothetical protein
MSKVRKSFVQDMKAAAQQLDRDTSKDTAAAEAESQARKEARRSRALSNIEADKARAAAARLEKVFMT